MGPATAHWVYCASSLDYDCTRPVTKRFGLRGDVPIPRTNSYGSWADGEAALFRPSTGQWLYGPMCKPGASGSTTCSTLWYGPFRLGDSESVLMPDLWDGDERTDFAVYEPRTATLRIRRSETGWRTLTREFGEEFVPGLLASNAERAGTLVVPEYRSYWNGSATVQRRTFAMFDFGSMTWITKRAWWAPSSDGFQRCALGTSAGTSLGRLIPFGGATLNDDLESDRFALFLTSKGDQFIDSALTNTNSCGSPTTVAIHVASAVGRGLGDSIAKTAPVRRISGPLSVARGGAAQ